jgi:hypothetical protein
MKLRTFSFLLALSTTTVLAGAEPLKLKVGKGAAVGVVGLTLSHNGETLRLDVPMDALSGPAKAEAVSAALASHPNGGNWRATATGAHLRFDHLVDGNWVEVDEILDVVDTTGAGTQLGIKDKVVNFTLTFSPNATATGVDSTNLPSFITITVTDSLSWTQSVQAGDTAETLFNTFEAYMAELGEEGVEVTRLNAHTLKLRVAKSIAAFNWQVTDTGLLFGGIEGAGVIDR